MFKDEAREKAEALLKKLHAQHRRSGTEAVLIAHKLNTAEYLRGVGKPAHLIVRLYEHPSIDRRMQDPSGRDCPGERRALGPLRPKRPGPLISSDRALRRWVFLLLILYLDYLRYSRSR